MMDDKSQNGVSEVTTLWMNKNLYVCMLMLLLMLLLLLLPYNITV